MLPSGECLRRITLATAMVDEFVETTLTLTKHNFYLATTVHFNRHVFVRISTPKLTLYSAHQYDKLRKNVRRHDWS
jgi:hypothetical protein